MATNDRTWNVANRLHSQKDSDNPEVNHIIAGADEIYDDEKELKQSEHNAQSDGRLNVLESDLNAVSGGIKDRLSTLENEVAFEGEIQVENTPQGIVSGSGKVATANAVRGAVDVRTGYFLCETAASQAAKTVAAPGFVLTPGGSIKILMTNANTADNATLNISQTGAKALYYDGERASSVNSWEEGETVEVYYDGTNFYANNVAGGSGNGDGGFDVSAKYPTSGVDGGNTYTLDGALAVLNANLSAKKKKGGMSIKFIQSSVQNSGQSGSYVQYRYMGTAVTGSPNPFLDTNNWQGVDAEPTAGSKYLVESGGVFAKAIKLYGISSKSSSGCTKVGDCYYNNSQHKIYRCSVWKGTAGSSKYEEVPFLDGAVYTYNNNFYIWDGENLVVRTFDLEIIPNVAGGVDLLKSGSTMESLATESEISQKGVIELAIVAGAGVSSALEPGQYGFSTGASKVIVFRKSSTSYVTYDPSLNGLYRYNGIYFRWDGTELVKDDAFLYEKDVSYISGYDIITNVAIGSVVDLTPDGNNNWEYSIIDAYKGDSFIITGTGGKNSRAWAVLDKTNKLVSLSESNAVLSDYVLNIEADGKVVLNANKTFPASCTIKRLVKNIPSSLKELDDKIEDVTDVVEEATEKLRAEVYLNDLIIEPGGINNNGNNAVTSSRVRTKGYIAGSHTVILDANKGIKLYRVYYYNKTTLQFSEYVSVNAYSANIGSEGKVARLVFSYSDSADIVPSDLKDVLSLEDLDSRLNDAESYIQDLKQKRSALVKFEFTHNIMDLSSILANLPADRSDWMADVYSRFDALVSANSNYITRVDLVGSGLITFAVGDIVMKDSVLYECITACDDTAWDGSNFTAIPDFASGTSYQVGKLVVYDGYAYKCKSAHTASEWFDANWEVIANKYFGYPRYANGISSGDTEYDETPAYKTYMYKFVDENTNVYSDQNKRKKLLIVSGTHAEYAGVLDSYVLAYNLCNNFLEDANFMKLRAAFDIYIIPCLNGYGLLHKQRNNARNIDIDRNYPVKQWTRNDANYTGIVGGSEFENQLVMTITNLWNPDIAIDHHNHTGSSKSLVYTQISDSRHLQLVLQSAVDIAYTIFKAFPQYFGTDYDSDYFGVNSCAPQTITPQYQGKTDAWWYQNGVAFPTILEVTAILNNVNSTWMTIDTFNANEYIFRNQLLRFCQWVLDNV